MRRWPAPQCSADGFTLVEVVVALSLLAVLSAGVMHLFGVSIDASRVARDRTIAVVAAAGKMEQLRSLEWRFALDASGLPTPRTDLTTDASRDPMGPGGPGLAESPPGTLDRDTPRYADYLDRQGRWVGNGTSPPGTAVYVRRWGVHRLPSDPARMIAFEVLVTTLSRERARTTPAPRLWNGEDVRLLTMVVRSVR